MCIARAICSHSLLTDLLDTARIDAGKLVLDEQPVDVHAALAECLRLVEAQALAGKGHSRSITRH